MARLALLICDTPIALLDTYGDYNVIYRTHLRASLDAIEGDKPSQFTLDGYDVVKGVYPADDAHYDGVVITGSAANAYDDVEWINTLAAYVARLADAKPHVKIIGICFGHQVVARALGGECAPNGGRWEVGMSQVGMTELGKNVFGVEMVNIHQMHRDHVTAMPPSFHLLGSTATSPIQGMARFSPSCGESATLGALLPRLHILTVQGHPEFTDGIIEALVQMRLKSGVLKEGDVEQARARMGWKNEGVDVVGRAIWGVFGVNGCS